jgi:hypothetical protein
VKRLILGCLIAAVSCHSGPSIMHRIGVGVNPHFLTTEDGRPFFWLGDTGWEMIHRLTREEIEFYMDRRAEQDFNVIQTVLLSEFGGLKIPNAYGDLPLIDGDPMKPDTTSGADPADEKAYDYWDHVDFACEAAAVRGLHLALVAAWGEYVVPRAGGKCFDTPEQAYAYGRFLGNRYRNRANIVWILGGDRHPTERPGGAGLWRAMAEGIADGTNGGNRPDGEADFSTTCMTHHAFGSSSLWFHADRWIDFHMWGSYHSDFSVTRAFEQAASDWALGNPKPTVNGEPAYENHPVNWLENNGRFTAFDSRQAAYWSVFAGACGHTYGCHDIWQFFDNGREPVSFADTPWRTAIDFPGARQMRHLRRLIESRPMAERVPDQGLIAAAGAGSGSGTVRACRGKHYAFVYIPTGNPVTILMGKIEGRRVKAWWFDPRNGAVVRIGEMKNSARAVFDPPGLSKELEWLQTGRGCDWVLVLDDAEARFEAPGSGPLQNRN